MLVEFTRTITLKINGQTTYNDDGSNADKCEIKIVRVFKKNPIDILNLVTSVTFLPR